MVLVSVVMASYNHENYLAEAINSVLTQTIQDLELIIIDDCSKDTSKTIIETFQSKDPRIKPIFHTENKGMYKTYNDGINNAQGKYVAFLDSDDMWLETKLEKQLSVLEKNQDLIVWSEGEVINQNGKATGQMFTQIENGVNREKSGNIFEELLCDDNFVFDSSLILKRENLPKGGFDESLKYLSDYRFVVDLARKYGFFFLKEPLAKYRLHGKNSIFRNPIDWHQDRIAIYQYFIKNYGNELPKKIRSNLFFRMGRAYAEIGENKLARKNIFKAIKMNPFGKQAGPYLIFALLGVRLMM